MISDTFQSGYTTTVRAQIITLPGAFVSTALQSCVVKKRQKTTLKDESLCYCDHFIIFIRLQEGLQHTSSGEDNVPLRLALTVGNSIFVTTTSPK